MSILKTGVKNMRSNFNILVNKPVESEARHRAILTIAKKNGITYDQAVERQAIRIIQSQARKK